MIIAVTGLPGTGKTTFARSLAHAVGTIHLNTDIVRHLLHMRGRYQPEDKARVYDALFTKLEDAIKLGKHVVVDGTFYSSELRTRLREVGDKHDIPVTWIELQADEEVIRKRVVRHREYSEADFDAYQAVKAQYEPIKCMHLVLRSDRMTPGEMTKTALSFLNIEPAEMDKSKS